MPTHTPEEQVSSFASVECVVADSLRFKSKLAIGEDAYTSLRAGKALGQLWDVGGVAATGAQVAASSVVATKFFATSGWLAALGLGAAAATPIGWVVAASVVTGGAYYGVTRLFRSYSGSRVEVIPKFINTPIDLLAASLFDMIGALCVKVAQMDGVFSDEERIAISRYFVEEWGLDRLYVAKALEVIEENSTQSSLAQMIEAFSSFARSNPDCNFSAMRKEIVGVLREVAHSDGRLDEREEMAIEKIDRMMKEADSIVSSIPDASAVKRAVAAPAQAFGHVGKWFKRPRKNEQTPPSA